MVAGCKGRGGARPGAGRKPIASEEKRVAVTVKVSPETRKKIIEIKARGYKKGRILDRAVEEFSI